MEPDPLDPEDVIAGTWLNTTGEPLVEREDLALAIARRRGTTPRAVAEELRAVDAVFDIDGVYVAPEKRDGR